MTAIATNNPKKLKDSLNKLKGKPQSGQRKSLEEASVDAKWWGEDSEVAA